MTATLPSQICSYLSRTLRTRDVLPPAAALSKVGAITGFIELYDQIPSELFRLPEDQYADLVEALGSIRLAVDQFRAGKHPDCLRPVGTALQTAWHLIELLPDQVPSGVHDLMFIGDPAWREMIGRDISAITTDLASGEWKSVTILAGSCCESLLLYGLQSREAMTPRTISTAVAAITWPRNRPNAIDLTDRSWDLFSYTEVAHQLRLILGNTRTEVDTVRDYRNLIHPAKVIREQTNCDRGTAFVSVGALEHVIVDLRKNL